MLLDYLPIATSLAKHWFQSPWVLYLHSQLSAGIVIPPIACPKNRPNRIPALRIMLQLKCVLALLICNFMLTFTQGLILNKQDIMTSLGVCFAFTLTP